MSERQARLKRKNPHEETVTVKKSKKSDIITNLIIAIITVAIIALGAWAVYSKYHTPAEDTEVTDSADESAAQVQTVAQAAEEKGLSADEFIAEYGLENVEDITGDSDFQAVMQSMTLENYAKYLDEDLDELISSANVDAELTGDTTVGEVMELVAQAQAEAEAETETETEPETETETEADGSEE